MSGEHDRCIEVERRLADLGISARVKPVGEEGAIALIRPDGDIDEGLLSESRAQLLEASVAAGFRRAALELFWE
jgi:hypothetical protein